VKSGNAGNSSKADRVPSSQPTDLPEDKLLFPSGSKVPLSLLHERQALFFSQRESVNLTTSQMPKRRVGEALRRYGLPSHFTSITFT